MGISCFFQYFEGFFEKRSGHHFFHIFSLHFGFPRKRKGHENCPKVPHFRDPTGESAIFGVVTLVSHYSAIGDTVSCDAPYSAMGFRGKFFLRCPPCWVSLWIAIGHFYGKKWGCSSDSLRYHRKHSATGPKNPPVLKTLRIVNLLSAVNSLRR